MASDDDIVLTHSIAGNGYWFECDECPKEGLGVKECNEDFVLLCKDCLKKKEQKAREDERNGRDEQERDYVSGMELRIAELEDENEWLMWECLHAIGFSPAWDDRMKETRTKVQEKLQTLTPKNKEVED